MASKLNILFTGATGYIGGEVFAKLLDHPKFSTFNITALVRSPEKAEKLRALQVQVVVGSHSDEPLMEKLASEADIVIATADADNVPAAKATLRGLKKRYAATKVPPTFIHTSGTGVLTDDAKGLYPTDTIYDDLNVVQLNSLPDTQFHRNVDLELLGGDEAGYVKTYIILPSTIYGLASSKLVDLGIQNRHSVQIPHLIRAAIDRGRGGMVGPGKNIWPNVHITEIADVYMTVLNAILHNKNPGHGREGLYFGENGEYTMYQLAKRISEVLVELGLGKDSEPSPFTTEEIDKYFDGSLYMGTNSRCRANRARALGWKPTKTTDDMLSSVKPEVEAILEERKRTGSLAVKPTAGYAATT
ncbi:hypothetical protein D9611_006508 [Ephemerocybe angulata]|uniref:NAD(P)-binding domain-containing protein n=1 Tax=Ephemerocybe angulata TaxID=980116 RepID=A0A8H5FH47_9AGAR|nr:hypothetical protein D9611_006508 [Tulosesus angulatus]